MFVLRELGRECPRRRPHAAAEQSKAGAAARKHGAYKASSAGLDGEDRRDQIKGLRQDRLIPGYRGGGSDLARWRHQLAAPQTPSSLMGIPQIRIVPGPLRKETRALAAAPGLRQSALLVDGSDYRARFRMACCKIAQQVVLLGDLNVFHLK